MTDYLSEIEWVTFTRRTDDPKLSWLERLLDVVVIPHRRNGYSWHAPIMQVPSDKHDECWELLNIEVTMPDGTVIRLDDIDDDHPLFYGNVLELLT